MSITFTLKNIETKVIEIFADLPEALEDLSKPHK